MLALLSHFVPVDAALLFLLHLDDLLLLLRALLLQRCHFLSNVVLVFNGLANKGLQLLHHVLESNNCQMLFKRLLLNHYKDSPDVQCRPFAQLIQLLKLSKPLDLLLETPEAILNLLLVQLLFVLLLKHELVNLLDLRLVSVHRLIHVKGVELLL